MKLFDDCLCQGFLDGAKEVVEGNEVVGRLYDVVHWHGFLILETDGACLKDVACLFLGQFAALNAIAVVGELHLSLMVESSLAMRLLLINEISEMHSVSLEEAMDIFYNSPLLPLLEDGIADLHCRSDKYLAEEIWREREEI